MKNESHFIKEKIVSKINMYVRDVDSFSNSYSNNERDYVSSNMSNVVGRLTYLG